jgi:hypothetical protein
MWTYMLVYVRFIMNVDGRIMVYVNIPSSINPQKLRHTLNAPFDFSWP